jgi:iron complex transport system substrate-binding protein
VFDEPDRYEAIAAFHDSTLARIRTALPPAERRPNALLCFAGTDDPGRFCRTASLTTGPKRSSSAI